MLVLVACSGGPDSVALAAAAAVEGPRVGVRVGAVVVDHGWFEGSAGVAARAAEICRGLGLEPVEVVPAGRTMLTGASGAGGGGDASVSVVPGGGGLGPEGEAREGRYAALEAARERLGAVAVLLGHTLDDQAETVLLGLARGSGARSLSGMAPSRGYLRRPLLGERRATTLAACAELGLEPWHDPANADPAYTRSRLRPALALLDDALGPGLPEALARTAEQLREDADTLDALAAALLAAAAAPPPTSLAPGGAPGLAAPPAPSSPSPPPAPAGARDGAVAVREWDVAVLAGAPVGVRRRALMRAARESGAGPLTRVHVLALDALIMDWKGQGAVSLPGGVEGSRACGRLRLALGGMGHDVGQEQRGRE